LISLWGGGEREKVKRKEDNQRKKKELNFFLFVLLKLSKQINLPIL